MFLLKSFLIQLTLLKNKRFRSPSLVSNKTAFDLKIIFLIKKKDDFVDKTDERCLLTLSSRIQCCIMKYEKINILNDKINK